MKAMHLVTGTRAELDTKGTLRPRQRTGVFHQLMEALVSFAGGEWKAERRAVRKQMQVIETLAVGPKKHLVLVRCGVERFLVGTGADCVQTIVRVGPEMAAAEANGASQRGVWV